MKKLACASQSMCLVFDACSNQKQVDSKLNIVLSMNLQASCRNANVNSSSVLVQNPMNEPSAKAGAKSTDTVVYENMETWVPKLLDTWMKK